MSHSGPISPEDAAELRKKLFAPKGEQLRQDRLAYVRRTLIAENGPMTRQQLRREVRRVYKASLK